MRGPADEYLVVDLRSVRCLERRERDVGERSQETHVNPFWVMSFLFAFCCDGVHEVL